MKLIYALYHWKIELYAYTSTLSTLTPLEKINNSKYLNYKQFFQAFKNYQGSVASSRALYVIKKTPN